MNNNDHELFEAELRRLKPAALSGELMARLLASAPAAHPAASEASAGLGMRQPTGVLASAAGQRQRPGALQDAGAPTLRAPQPLWRLMLRWLAPAAALGAVAVVVLVGRPSHHQTRPQPAQPAAPEQPVLKADAVEVDQRLVGSFDTIARLPSGLPVRFRCREWADELVLRDTARGIVVEQRVPRIEVVPVSFETY
jgi:hypothetical protein